MTAVEGDPMTEDITSPQSEAGQHPAKIPTQQEAQGQPKTLFNNPLQLAGLQHGVLKPFSGIKGMQLLPIHTPASSQNGTGSTKATKLPPKPKEVIKKVIKKDLNEEDEKYGRILPGPWDQTPCPNTQNQCKGTMEAFYTLEFEEGNSFMYKCSSCSVITSISFRESNIKYND
jgi:hypothetical protein